MDIDKIHPDQFTYNLPEEKIAKVPLKDRASSKLLQYNKGDISHYSFHEINKLLPESATIFFNDTRVIPARLIFHKTTGAKIEIFLLEPLYPSADIESTMIATEKCQWNCMIGNARKWKEDLTLVLQLDPETFVRAERNGNVVEFSWDGRHTFSEILEKAGKVPLPPYIDREPTELDIPRYQTVYSRAEGAVAAPTAGLHFTPDIMKEITKNHPVDYVTLHVSAGTFQPIKSSVREHPMHREQVMVSRKNLETILDSSEIIAVGTTSMRTLESLYWYGVQLMEGKEEFLVEKLAPYEDRTHLPSVAESIGTIAKYMDKKGMSRMLGYTEIFLFPGYEFKLCRGLITNFHLPGTTLMMLVAAFVGEDWKNIYQEALNQNYRFLSYGDSSLLYPGK